MKKQTIMQINNIKILSPLLTLIVLSLVISIEAHSFIFTAEPEQKTLGSTQVGKHTVAMKIAYEADSALLIASVPGSDGSQKYIPLIASTYRGIPPFQIDVLSPDTNNEIWFKMSKPRNEILAHYRFGSETALTPFGHTKLLETPFPQYLNGSPIVFPKEGWDTTRLRASFFHYDDM